MKKAVLVAVQLPQTSNEDNSASLQELGRLVTTLGYTVIGQMSQRRSSQRAAAVLGEGRLKALSAWTGGPGVVGSMVHRKKNKAELKTETEDGNSDEIETAYDISEAPQELAEVVIFDCDLSPSQLRNVESATGVLVLDRTGVIIEIFSRHARTRAARLQVEIARLTYLAPRLRETSGSGDRQGGGIGGKGSGETRLELDKRQIRDRLKELKTELASIANEHLVRRARRDDEFSVALVGYTNAGKSSLMRGMTGSEVLVADKLFATLDTTVRALAPETRPKILISDTVGFIKKLPHDLVASFKSTLDEALNASLLLFVVDASDPTFRSQLDVTKSVLSEVGATQIPNLMILNKRDLLSPAELETLKIEFPDAICISSRDSKDLQELRTRLIEFFETNMTETDLFIPYNAAGIIGDIRSRIRVLAESYDDRGTTFKVRISAEDLSRIQKKLLHHT